MVLTRQELTNFKLELICSEVDDDDDGREEYDMQMDEPYTPKRPKYTPNTSKK